MSSREDARENALVAATTSTLITARRYGSGITAAEFGPLVARTMRELAVGADEQWVKTMRLTMLVAELAGAAAYLLDQLALHDPERAEDFVRGLAKRGSGGE
jgi:hypothetical protein